jgi:hypothetical protein
MRVKELIELLKRFDPEAPVRMCMSLPGRVISTHENLWVGDYGGGPQLTAALDFKQFHIYVGCGLEQMVLPVPQRAWIPPRNTSPPQPAVDLGHYDDEETAARVHDFYIYHHKLNEPLHNPGFDYEHWIPPRTTSGEYNEHIAKILRQKLLEE